MKSKRTFSKIYYWARKAAKLNLDTVQGEDDFYELARESKLGTRQLAYYLNAYQSAGESGLKALSYRRNMPDNLRKDAVRKLSDYLHNRVPEHIRNKVWHIVESQSNRITIIEKRPFYRDRSRTTSSPMCQVRYTDYDERWHLYWRRASGQWWPYIPGHPLDSIEDCIKEINNDPHGCFWG